jgi:hypothetical protein
VLTKQKPENSQHVKLKLDDNVFFFLGQKYVLILLAGNIVVSLQLLYQLVELFKKDYVTGE